MPPESSTPLTPEDLAMLYSDQPRQRTTMSMLMLLDHRPDPARLRASVWRAVEARRLPIQDIYHLPLDVAMAKMIAVSFYFGEIHREHFFGKFGVRLEDHFPQEVDFVLQRGLMAHAGPYLRLTPLGAEHFNGVVALFYTGAVKEVLIHLEGPGDSEAKAVWMPTAITAAQKKERCER